MKKPRVYTPEELRLIDIMKTVKNTWDNKGVLDDLTSAIDSKSYYKKTSTVKKYEK